MRSCPWRFSPWRVRECSKGVGEERRRSRRRSPQLQVTSTWDSRVLTLGIACQVHPWHARCWECTCSCDGSTSFHYRSLRSWLLLGASLAAVPARLARARTQETKVDQFLNTFNTYNSLHAMSNYSCNRMYAVVVGVGTGRSLRSLLARDQR